MLILLWYCTLNGPTDHWWRRKSYWGENIECISPDEMLPRRVTNGIPHHFDTNLHSSICTTCLSVEAALMQRPGKHRHGLVQRSTCSSITYLEDSKG